VTNKAITSRVGAGVAAVFAAALVGSAPATAQLEAQFAFGGLLNPFTGESRSTAVSTIQHAGTWALGETFLFLDHTDDRGADGFNDRDIYGEWYPTLSISSLAGRRAGLGPVRDIQVIAGVNIGIVSRVRKYVPGIRLSWDLPGFIFVNTDFTAYRDDSGGVDSGGAPKTGDGWGWDVSWLSIFGLAGQTFQFTGHAEYVSGVGDELGGELNSWVLAQPQLRWDLGQALAGSPNTLHAGFEYQLWLNKLGTDEDENTIQFLLVWIF